MSFDGTTREVGRFAPSPTGALHAGSLLAAFGSWLRARAGGGAWRLRIEDVDTTREVAGAADAQRAALVAFGLVADGEVVVQSTRGDAYAAALSRLLATGDAFECHCSRADLAATGGVHRACVPGARRDDPAIRLRVSGRDDAVVTIDDLVHGRLVQDVAVEVGDVVLRRADGLWAYQLAVVVDDAWQGVTEVVRGADLLDSTPRQVLLQRRLGLPTPRYLHLPLLLGPDGAKLSKSHAALPVDPRDPLPALRRAWRQLGQDDAALARIHDRDALLAAAVAAFDAQRIPRGPLHVAATHNGTVADAP